MIELTNLNHNEAVRYLGGSRVEMNDQMRQLLDSGEQKVLATAKPKYLYKELDLHHEMFSEGESIRNHLEGCERAVLVCATLGADIDKLIRITSVTDMASSVVIDALSSVAIEQVGVKLDELLATVYEGYYLTFRFSPGYGDFPIELQPEFLKLLDAPRKIGLTTSGGCLLTPTKSITAVVGLSKTPLKTGARGCATCRLRETCQIRKRGDHCGY